MKSVWKFQLDIMDTCLVELPRGAKVLSFAFQQSIPHLWVLVNPKETEKDRRWFKLLGTGHIAEEPNLIFIGTAFVGALVFHLFEVPDA